jgi:hypothetical protein
LVGPGLVGLGDVYLPAVLGMLLGTGPVSSIVVGALAPFLLNTPISAVRLALRRIRRGSHIAWAPYLIAGALLTKVYRSEIQFRLRCLRILADESTEDLRAAYPCRGESRDRSRQHVNVGWHLVSALMGPVVVVVRDVVGERGEQVALSVDEHPVEAFAA